MNGDLKTAFVQACLTDYMKSVITTMKAVAARMGIGVTDEAINSLAFEIIQNGKGAIANLKFEQVLRFVDMGVGRGHPLGGMQAMRITLDHNKRKAKNKIGRKAKKVYSKVAYGKLTWMENRLLYGYTEEAIATLKEQLQNNTN